MIKKCFQIIFLFGLLLTASTSNAQYYLDALRYAQRNLGGTARIQGLGGASVALGGDLSNGMINPAGLGFNRKSEISFTPALGFNSTNSEYFTYPGNSAETTRDSRINFNIASLGAVFSKARNGISSNYGGAFSISVNRINSFNNSISYRGVNDSTQLVDALLQEAGGIPWDEFDQQGEDGFFDYLGLAYFTYLIGPDYDADPQNFNEYTTPIAPPQVFPTLQEENIETRGGHYEWNFSYGGNYDDRIYYGVGLGIQTLTYDREREYRESIDDAQSPFDNLVFLDRLNQSGLGVNVKAGVIVRATDRLRIGFNAVSPTWMRITENFEEELFTSWNNISIFDGFNEDGSERFTLLTDFNQESFYDEIFFSLKTPGRLSAGLAYFFSKNGFVTADVEYVNYGGITLNNPRFSIDGFGAGFDFDGDNQVIEDIYRSVVNIRTGAEIRTGVFRFRGGFAYYGDPYQVDDRLGNSVMSFTGGVGLRKQNFYTDFAVVAETFSNVVRPYTFQDGITGALSNPMATIDQSRVRALFSVGFFY